MIVFNTWNAMIGCGTVTIPWAFQQSGILLGIFFTGLACAFSFLTNYLLLRVAGTDTDFSATMHKYFPRLGWPLSMVFFIINFYVGIILFFQVLSQSLYPIILYAIGSDAQMELTTDWSQFSLSYTCLLLLVLVLIMTAPRDTMYVQRVNAFGVVFVIIIILFIVSTSFQAIPDTKFVYSEGALAAARAPSE